MSKPIKTIRANSSTEADQLELQQNEFIRQIGLRVLSERQAQQLSRRELAERAEVSQRTIVLLETGVGNISIALLYRIANALEHSVEWFLATDELARGEADRIADYYKSAGPVEQQRILNVLSLSATASAKSKRLCLIGLRGAGKSTLGEQLGQTLSMPFVELNNEIEQLSGMSTQELMSLYGQEGYRKLERQALEKIVEHKQSVILAAAGGVVSEPDTLVYLMAHFHTVWLKASPEEHMNRVREQGDERPMAGNPQAMVELKSILTSRESQYASADAMVDTSAQTIEQSHEDLIQAVKLLLNL